MSMTENRGQVFHVPRILERWNMEVTPVLWWNMEDLTPVLHRLPPSSDDERVFVLRREAPAPS